MAYNYTPGTFGTKDALTTGDSDKALKGSEFETEFLAIKAAIALLLEIAGPTFTGTLTGGDIDVTGDITCDGTIDGGSYT